VGDLWEWPLSPRPVDDAPPREDRRGDSNPVVGQLIKLNVEPLTYEQRAELIVLCEQKLGEFVKRRGMATRGLPAHRNRSRANRCSESGAGRCKRKVCVMRGHEQGATNRGGSHRPSVTGWVERLQQPSSTMR